MVLLTGRLQNRQAVLVKWGLATGGRRIAALRLRDRAGQQQEPCGHRQPRKPSSLRDGTTRPQVLRYAKERAYFSTVIMGSEQLRIGALALPFPVGGSLLWF